MKRCRVLHTFIVILSEGKEGIAVGVNEEIIQDFISGHEEVFAEIINQYKAYIFAIILKFVNNPNDAQDIAQEVFLQIYQSLPHFRPDNFKAWIGKISANKAIDWKRANKKQNFITGGLELQKVEDERQWVNPEKILLEKDYRERVREVCKQLPENYGNVIEKFYFQSRTYEEIAREEGLSLRTVESRLYRARKMFREKWKEGVSE